MPLRLIPTRSIRAAFPMAVRAHGQYEPTMGRASMGVLLPDDPAAPAQLLFAQNRDKPVMPASLVKLALAHIVYDRIKDGALSFDDRLTLSRRAQKVYANKSGAAMMTVREALTLIAVASCNDAAIALAEHIGGSEWKFVHHHMRPLAQRLTLSYTEFWNATGLPTNQSVYWHKHNTHILPDNVSTAGDLSSLAAALIRNHPEFLSLSSLREFDFNGTVFRASNPFIRRDFQDSALGHIDGLKTGTLKFSGMHLAATAVKDGRRILILNLGQESESARIDSTAELIRRAFDGLRRLPPRALKTG